MPTWPNSFNLAVTAASDIGAVRVVAPGAGLPGERRLLELTVGLVSGNVGLARAAAGCGLIGQQQVEFYMAASVFPIFTLPALTRPVVARLRRAPRPAPVAPDPMPPVVRPSGGWHWNQHR
jgi:hypothetical protein